MGRRATAGREVIVVGTEGYTARIELPGALAAPVRSALRDLVVTEPGDAAHTITVTTEPAGPVITVDGIRWVPGEHQSLCDQLIYVLMRASLDAAPDRLHLHGGYVARHGHGVFVAGYPVSGKSTLVTRLVESGFDYFTDERVAIDRDLAVVALAKPISLTAGSFARLAHLDPRLTGNGSATPRLWHVPASAVREGSLGADATPTAIVFLHREDGAALEVSPVHPVEMARLLLSDSPDAGRFGRDAVEVTARLCASVRCRRVVCDDTSTAVGPIEELAELDPPGPGPEVQLIHSGTTAAVGGAPATSADAGPVVAVAPGVSGVVIDGRALLRTGAGELVELPEPLSVWLQLFDGHQALGEIVAEVAAENEMPEDAVMDVARTVLGQLTERSLVR